MGTVEEELRRDACGCNWILIKGRRCRDYISR
jgi:hypothetical protein